jgi:hypothetical protein
MTRTLPASHRRAGRPVLDAGHSSWHVSAGGDICTAGAPPGLAAWTFGIADRGVRAGRRRARMDRSLPDHPTCAVSTSGAVHAGGSLAPQ